MRHLLRLGTGTALVAAALLTGCASPPGSTTDETPTGGPVVALPPAGAAFDYQLGGAYDPPAGTRIVVRDRSAAPAEGSYSICYVNGFQTQPGEFESWPDEALLIRDGEPVFDPDWPDEALLDTSREAARSVIVETVRPWIEGCAEDGFDAVEFDNLDTYARSDGALSLADNLRLAREFVTIAHDSGLAAGQKNAAEAAPRLRSDAGFDFAVVEECAAFAECEAYRDAYGEHVIDIEYTDQLPAPFPELCRTGGLPASAILRDRDLVTPDDPEYAYERCADDRSG